jgi:hypothetical protein
MAFTNSDKALCAEREVQMRERVYRVWIAAGKMSQARADRELAIMREIAMEYRDKAIKDAAAADLFSIRPPGA